MSTPVDQNRPRTARRSRLLVIWLLLTAATAGYGWWHWERSPQRIAGRLRDQGALVRMKTVEFGPWMGWLETDVTDTGLAALQSLPQLNRLAVSHNDDISSGGIERLLQARPDARIVQFGRVDGRLRVRQQFTIDDFTPDGSGPAQ